MSSADEELGSHSASPRFTTPIVVVGLLLAAVLAGWCLVQAITVQSIRSQGIQYRTLLREVDATEAAFEELSYTWRDAEWADFDSPPLADNLAALSDAVDELRSWTLQATDRSLADDVGKLATALDALVQTLSAGSGQSIDNVNGVNEATFETVESMFRTVVTSAHAGQHQHSMLLAEHWESLYLAVVVSVLLAVGLAVGLLVRMSQSQRRHDRDMAALRESERRFRLLAEHMPGVIYLCRNDARYTMLVLNDAVEDLTGYPAADFKEDRISFVDLFHPSDAARIPGEVDAALKKREPFELKYRLKRRDGEWRVVEEYGVGVFDGDTLEYLEGVILDVTQRQAAEDALEQQRAYLRQVLDLNPSYIFAKDRDGRFTLANEALAKAYGTTVNDLIGRTDADFNSNPEEVEKFRHDDLVVMDSLEPLDVPEEVVTDAEGNSRWFQTVKKPIINEDGVANEMLGVAIDITRLKRAEQIKTGRNKVLERIATGAPAHSVLGLVTETFREFDSDLCCAILDNRSGRQVLVASAGLDLSLQRRLQELAADDELTGCRTALESGHRVIMEDMHADEPISPCAGALLEAGFRSYWIEPIQSDQDAALGVLAVLGTKPGEPDAAQVEIMESSAQIAGIIIQRARAEEELRQSQERLRVADRLASIGTLTAGLGHDMNNVLFPLRCRLETVDWANQTPEQSALLVAVRDTVNYLQQLSDGLRQLAADPEHSDMAGARTNLDEWWPQVRPLIQDALPSKTPLEDSIPRGLPALGVEPHRLTQAVLNLVINAAEATTDGSPVVVRAQAGEAGRVIRLSVADRGCGMTEEVMARVLEPFYTTKTRGLSTGLGLSLVHGVTKSAGGDVSIDSAPGRGTTITLTLPVVVADESPNTRQQFAVVTLSDARTAGWITSLLRSEGYTVQLSRAEQPTTGALWVTEATEKNLEVAESYRARCPDAPIIVFGDSSPRWDDLDVIVVDRDSDLSHIQRLVKRCADAAGGSNHERDPDQNTVRR